MVRPPKQSRLLTHGQVWAALDRLAERAGMSPSGLARRAGLDPTTFNKSKRITADGRERWPSTESVAKALAATNVSIDAFVQLIGDGGGRGGPSVPLIGLAEAAASDAFDDNGFPTGKGWDEVALPTIPDEHAYALEISGDTLRPVFREGDIILVSPSTPIRRGDRVVLRTKDGEMLVKECKRRTAKTLELQSFNPAEPDRTLAAEDVAWIARIVWVRQ
ncbi:helix-turn-helix transcriptional regulator [Bradyrhizobium sp. 31Argb]|uniref:S24 family peptidase n=1 Tax=unclassified Bradyrhizobium TaxID=2631580 RepID=UPI001A9259BF|nr:MULTISPECIES: helix-turn-helix transcriptional regulator [unclassified Bradyrhizobium]MDI4239355.1 helix-turn-helix transcriptional regulator [Bradyrhizobium sp. Arg237L]